MKGLSLPMIVLLVVVAAFVGFYAGALHQARIINAEIEAQFALPLATPGPLFSPASLTVNP